MPAMWQVAAGVAAPLLLLATAPLLLLPIPLAALLLAGLALAYGLPRLYRKAYKVHATGGVVISGASSGMGKQMAFMLAARTKLTIFAGVRKQADAEKLTAEAEAQGLRVVPVLLDVTSDESVQQAKQEVLRALKGEPVVAVVNNAGSNVNLPFELLPVEDHKWVYETHVFGAHRLTQAFLPELRQSSGRILFTNSVLAYVCQPGWGAYSSVKAAQLMMTNQLRLELATFGISVSGLHPGVFKSELGTNAQAATGAAMGRADATKVHLYPQYMACPMERFGALFQLLLKTAPSVADDAVLHALTAQYPEVEYFVSAFGEFYQLPVWLLVRLEQLLPRRVNEAIVNGLTARKQRELRDCASMKEFRGKFSAAQKGA